MSYPEIKGLYVEDVSDKLYLFYVFSYLCWNETRQDVLLESMFIKHLIYNHHLHYSGDQPILFISFELNRTEINPACHFYKETIKPLS